MKDKLSLGFFFAACAIAMFLIGVFTARYHLPPYRYIVSAISEVKTAFAYHQERLGWQYFRYDDAPETPDTLHAPNLRALGATLVSGFSSDPDIHQVRIVDAHGDIIQE
ncbi:hypothetical protein [Ruegeria sp.]|uniref:hypothetical protein n=1 Tax=Ruegeria sp. TaxID=1879320 RepID=UPI003B5B0C4F